MRVGAQRRTGGVGTSDQTLDATYELSTDSAILEKCTIAADSSCTADLVDPLDKQGLDAVWVRFSVVCAKGGDEQCTRAIRADVTQAAVTLKDPTPPVVGGVQVTDDGDRSGTLRLRFDAADVGGGLYRALVKVDGTPRAVVPLGTGECTDANPGDADPYQFVVPVPCPPVAAGVPVEISSFGLSAGPHTIAVDVEDAAGNATSAFVTQFPRPNVVAGSSVTLTELLDARLSVLFDRTKSTSMTSRFGDRVVLRGTLRSRKTGRGISGARIDVYHLVGTKLRSLTKTGLKTRAGGALTLILPRDLDTRRIRFTYRAVRPGKVTSESRVALRVRDKRGRLVRRVK